MPTLTYSVPDPEGEYCQEGEAPRYQIQRWQFKTNGFRALPAWKLDPENYPMDAEPEIRKRFVDAGYGDMVESH
ncbi:MAG: hypothetical protein IPP17_27640 [Bacteroidetes bacterium]|nr:hypothetical protein [Bacteroidota bacterium]